MTTLLQFSWKKATVLLVLSLCATLSSAQAASPSGKSDVDKLIQEKLNRAFQQRGQTNRVTIPKSPNTRPVTVAPSKVVQPDVMTPTVTRPQRVTPPAFPAFPGTATKTQNQATTTVGNTPNSSVVAQVAKTSNAGVSIPDPETILAPGFLNFKNMDLEQVLDIYSDLVQKTVLRSSQGTETQITIQAKGKLTKLEGVQALDTILAMNGITVIPFGEKFVKVVPVAEANIQGARFLDVPYADLPEADQFVTQVVQLNYSLASEVLQAVQTFSKNAAGLVAIDSSNVLVLRDYSSNVKRMMEVIEKIDVEVIRDVDLEVIPIKYALSSEIANVMGSLTDGGVSTTGGRNSGGLSGSSSSRLGSNSARGSSSSNGSSTQGRTSTSQSRTTPQQTASSSRSTFNNRLQQIVQRASQGGGRGRSFAWGSSDHRR
ncbi:hypothetical protein N9059_01745 [bacterium]|nr:hypothetical protein [bacterium]